MNQWLRTALVAVVSCSAVAGELPAARRVINIVNFVRGCEPRVPDRDLVEPLRKEIELNTKYRFPNTILLQYDAMIRDDLMAVAKGAESGLTEYGVWVEIVKPLVEKVGLEWRGRNGWSWDWFINPGFLMAYDPTDRRRLVDELFRLFKEKFGDYPKVVGSWLLDACSMEYMVAKYGVDGFCICREQDNTDAYGLRGGYSNGAYYPSRRNMLSAAVDMENAIRAPVFKMLTPDPIYNYGLPDKMYPGYPFPGECPTLEPVYSSGRVQRIIDWYFDTYTQSDGLFNLSYMQSGQENSFGWGMIGEGWVRQCAKIAASVAAGSLEVETLGTTARRFKSGHAANCVQTQVALEDWTGAGRKSVWYNCRRYRANLFLDGGRLIFRDIHKFVDSFEEPFLQKVCSGNVAEYFTPPIVDAYLFRETGEFRPLEFQGCFSELTVRTVPTDVLVLEAMGDKRVRITLSEDAICIDGGQFAIPPVSRDFSFKGCRYRIDVSSSDGFVTLHMDR